MWWIWLVALVIMVGIGEKFVRPQWMKGRAYKRMVTQRRRIGEALRQRPWEKYEEKSHEQFWTLLKEDDLDAAEMLLDSREPLL